MTIDSRHAYEHQRLIEAGIEADPALANYTKLQDASSKFGWQDNEVAFAALQGTGSTAPAFAEFITGLKYLRFGIGDDVNVVWHIKHDIKPNSTFHFHVHWSYLGTQTRVVRWQLSYAIAKGHQQEAFPAAATVLNIDQAQTGVTRYNMIAEDPVGITLPEPDSLIICNIKRVSNGGLDSTDQIFGFTADLHYQTDRHATINRSPNFYG